MKIQKIKNKSGKNIIDRLLCELYPDYADKFQRFKELSEALTDYRNGRKSYFDFTSHQILMAEYISSQSEMLQLRQQLLSRPDFGFRARGHNINKPTP